MFTLEGLKEASRGISIKAELLKERLESGIERELDLIRSTIQDRMKSGGDSSIAPFVKIDPAEKAVYLEYEMGSTDSGRRIVSARKKHNPAHSVYRYQPFQEALRDLGYEDIEPGPGASIPVTHGYNPPGIRLKAHMTETVVKRILGELDVR